MRLYLAASRSLLQLGQHYIAWSLWKSIDRVVLALSMERVSSPSSKTSKEPGVALEERFYYSFHKAHFVAERFFVE